MLTARFIAFLPGPGDFAAEGSRVVSEFAARSGMRWLLRGYAIALESETELPLSDQRLLLIRALPGSVRSAIGRECASLRGGFEDWESWAARRLQLFNLIRADHGSFQLVSDVLGLLHYFQAGIAGGLVVSSSLRLLFSCFPELIRPVDPMGVLEGISSDSPKSNRTLHKRVSRSRAGDVISWEPERGPEIDRRRRLQAPDIDPRLGSPGTLERLHQPLFEQIPRGIADPSRVLLPLTGGLDSRLIVCAAQAQGIQFEAVTLGLEQHREVRIARAVARTLGLNHRVAVPRQPALSRTNLWYETIEGQGGAGGLFIAALLDQGFPPGTTAMHGLLNDILAGGGWQFAVNRDVSSREGVREIIFKHFYKEPPASLTAQLGIDRAPDAWVEEISRELPAASEPYQSLLMWNLENKQRRLAGMLHLLGREYHVAVPAYTLENLRTWLSVDFQLKQEKKILLRIVSELYPAAGKIPRAEDPPRFTFRGWEATRYMLWLQAQRLRFALQRRLLPGGSSRPDPTVIWRFWHDTTETEQTHQIAAIQERGKVVGEVLDWDLPLSPRTPLWESSGATPSESRKLLRSIYLLVVYCEGLKAQVGDCT